MYNPYKYGTKDYYDFEVKKLTLTAELIEAGMCRLFKNPQRYTYEERQMMASILEQTYTDRQNYIDELDKMEEDNELQ